MSAADTGIDQATAARFQQDGVVHLEGAFADWLDPLRAGVERNMRTPGPYTREYEPEGSKGYFFGDYCNWARVPEYRDFVFHSHAAALAARLMGSGTARFFHEHVLVKEPKTESRTPWHHDLPYYCIDGSQCVSFWTALDPVPRPMCLELVVGSHRWGKSFMPRKFIGVDYQREGEALDTMPDIDGHRDETRSRPSTWRRATPSPSTSSPSTGRRATRRHRRAAAPSFTAGSATTCASRCAPVRSRRPSPRCTSGSATAIPSTTPSFPSSGRQPVSRRPQPSGDRAFRPGRRERPRPKARSQASGASVRCKGFLCIPSRSISG